jgi:histidine triad (HIT) family protein
MQQNLFADDGLKSGCIFCQILAGQSPAHMLYRDDDIACFLDIMPVSEGHSLIIPTRHHDDLFTLSQGELDAVSRFSRRLAPVLREVTDADGIGVHQLNGAAAGQTVFHYHMHLIPAKQGAPRQIHGRKMADQQQLADIAAKIRARL